MTEGIWGEEVKGEQKLHTDGENKHCVHITVIWLEPSSIAKTNNPFPYCHVCGGLPDNPAVNIGHL